LIKIGDYNFLKIDRISDLGYMLIDGPDEYLLHFKEAKCEHQLGDEVKVFIYYDKKERLTATEAEVFSTINMAGFTEVVDVALNAGVFVDINTPKDVFVSKDNLPYDTSLWPQIGDKLFVKLKMKKNQFVAKPLNRFDIIALHKNVNYVEGEKVLSYVIKIADAGISLITNDMMHVFVPRAQYRGKYRIGEELEVTITKKIDEEYYGTLNLHKELLMDTDKELILNYMNSNKGTMPLTAKSSAEDVFRILKMSRKAFKRAYGNLYKEHLIVFDDEKTTLVK